MIGLGLGIERFPFGAVGAGGGGGGVSPSDLAGYYIGIEASSFGDPGGNASTVSTIGTHRQATTANPVNLATSGPAFTWQSSGNSTRHILHSGGWNNLVSWPTIPAPNGEDWYSSNWGPEDPAFNSISSGSLDHALQSAMSGQSLVAVMFLPTIQAGQLFRPLYIGDGVNRIEVSNTGTGRILIRTSSFGPTNVVDLGDLRTDDWIVIGYSWTGAGFSCWVNGVEKAITGNISTLGGTITHQMTFYGSILDGGHAAFHAWNQGHSDADMNAQMSALATRFGISYTYTPI